MKAIKKPLKGIAESIMQNQKPVEYLKFRKNLTS
jgi:hypothetical protein